MADYSQPYLPSMLVNSIAANGLQKLFDTQRLNADLQSAGQTAETGDLAGASSQLLGTGHLNEAAKMQDMARQLKDDHLADVKTTYDKLGNLALMAQTPEDWSRAIAAAQSHGIDTKGFDDFETGRPAAIALAGKVGDVLTQEKTRRDIEVAKFKASAARFEDSNTYATTIKDETGADVPATRMRLRSGEWSEPVATPAGIDINAPLSATGKSARTSSEMQAIRQIQTDFKSRYNFDLDYADANAALRSGSKPVLDDNGEVKFEARSGTIQGTRDTRAQQNAMKYDPTQVYQRGLAQGMGKQDASNLGRVQQIHAVLGHLAMVDDLVGGTELDPAKLTPEQARKRQIAENGVGYLRSKIGYAILTGQMDPQSDTPDFLRNLHSAQVMLEGELTRLATMGQGAVAEGTRNHLNGIIGELGERPSVKNILSATRNIREMATVIASMPMIGNPQEGLINPSLRGGGTQQQSAEPSDAIAEARDAISRGAPREKVLERLRAAKISTEGL